MTGARAAAVGLALCCAASCGPSQNLDSTLAHGKNAIPIAQATSDRGHVFPAILSRTPSGCSFPAQPNPPVLEDFSREWYSSQLLAAREAPLVDPASPPSGFRVRFTWLRSFHPGVVVRMESAGVRPAKLTAKVLSGAGGYEPGTIATNIQRTLSPAEAGKLSTAINRSNLLSEPSTGCDLGMDGAQWIIEVADPSGYYFIERWSPERGAVREVGELLLELTGIEFGETY